MTQPTTNARMATSAIAAVLAMSATPLIAQTVPPPDTTTATSPAPTATTTDPLAPDPAATDAAAAPAASKAATKTTIRRTTHVAAAKPASAPVHVATRTVTSHTVSPKPAQAAVAAAPAVGPSPAAPIVDLNTKPAPPAPAVAAKPAAQPMTTELMFGLGALVLIALAAAAIAMRRRRRARDEWIDQERTEPAADEPEMMGASDPIFADQAAPAPAASAFAWGDAQRTAEPAAEDSDRLPGETWVERAYRGPSANNPSESLKTRLGRAAFFDKREREVAAGLAEPVDADEGLPEAMLEEQEGEPA